MYSVGALGCVSAPIAASINATTRRLRQNRRAEKETIVDDNSKEALKKRAEASFKKDERFPESAAAQPEYEAKDAIGEKTARLRALRLAKEAAENV
jgi:hypothetical protein